MYNALAEMRCAEIFATRPSKLEGDANTTIAAMVTMTIATIQAGLTGEDGSHWE